MPPPKKSKNWRERPITKAQHRQLERYDLPATDGMTQGEASDLIGSKRPPSADELRILRFFKIQGLESYSQTIAHRGIEHLFTDPDNVTKWEARPAEKAQREIYTFFKKPLPRGITWKQADTAIKEILDNEKNEEAWDDHQDHLNELEDEAFEREEWFQETLEALNEGAPISGYKTLSKKLFAQVVAHLETKGMTLEAIAENEDLILSTSAQFGHTRGPQKKPPPSPTKPRAAYNHSQGPPHQQAKQSGGFTQRIKALFLAGCGALLIAIFMASFLPGPTGTKKPNPRKATAATEQPACNAAQAKQLVQSAINETHVFKKIRTEPSVPKIIVEDVWFTLDFETKKLFDNAVLCYLANGHTSQVPNVQYQDPYTGKKVAQSGPRGFSME